MRGGSVLTLLLMLTTLPALAAPPALVELQIGRETVQGKVTALNNETCWFTQRDGRLDERPVQSIERVTRVEALFRPLSVLELRDRLRREMGDGYEVVATQRYVVCAASGRAAGYARRFEAVSHAFDRYFSVRGLRLASPEFPLVAIVLPDHASFAAYCRRDGIAAVRGLMGYYHRQTNRVALYEADATAQHTPGESGASLVAAIQSGLDDTIVHEGVHQAAFNTGLHTRIGTNPQWVVEGLATVFESPGVREATSATPIMARTNPERFVHFGNFVKQRRSSRSLEEFLRDDRLFRTAPLDAYSQAWALSFYLIETRPADYARYLKRIAQHDPLAEYGPDERVADFKAAFGRDLAVFEASFLRYLASVQ